jgi:hypothetical protein
MLASRGNPAVNHALSLGQDDRLAVRDSGG